MNVRVSPRPSVSTKQRPSAFPVSPVTTPPSSPPPASDAAAQAGSPLRRRVVVPPLSPDAVHTDHGGGAVASSPAAVGVSPRRKRVMPPLSSHGGGSPAAAVQASLASLRPAGHAPPAISPEALAAASSPRSPRSTRSQGSTWSPRSQSVGGAKGGTTGGGGGGGGGDHAATAGGAAHESVEVACSPRNTGSGSGSGRGFRLLMSPRRAAALAASPKSSSPSGERWRMSSRLRRGDAFKGAVATGARPSDSHVGDDEGGGTRSTGAPPQVSPSAVGGEAPSTPPLSSPLSADTIRIVKATAPVLEVHGGAIAATFYRILFDAHPSTAVFFDTTTTGDGTVQSDAQIRRLAGAVLAFAANVEHLDALAPALARISAKHVSRGVAAGLYAPVGQVLLTALAEVLGDAATPEILGAWADAYAFLSVALIGRERALRSASASAAAEGGGGGTWLGYTPFKVNRRVRETVSTGMALSLWLEPVAAPALMEAAVDGDVAAEAAPAALLPSVDWAAGQYVGVYLPGTDGGISGSIRRTVAITSAPRSPKGVRITFVVGAVGDRDNGTAHIMGAREGTIIHLSAPRGEFTVTNPAVVRRAASGVPAVFVVSEQGSVELVALAVEVMKAGREVYFVRVGNVKSSGEAAWISPAAASAAAEAAEAAADAVAGGGTAAAAAAIVSALSAPSPRRRATAGRSWKGAFGKSTVGDSPGGYTMSTGGPLALSPRWRRAVGKPRAAGAVSRLSLSSSQPDGLANNGGNSANGGGGDAGAAPFGQDGNLTGRWTVVERVGAPEGAPVVSPADCLFGLELLTAELSTSAQARLHQLLVAAPEEVTAAVGATVTATADWFLGSVPLSLLDEVRAHLVDVAGVDVERVLFADGV